MHSFRAFGDKSGPPSLPDAESEGQELNGAECEVTEEEEEKAKSQVEEEEKEQSPSETFTDQACSGVEELSLATEEGEKGEKDSEEEEVHKDDQKMPQGIKMRS